MKKNIWIALSVAVIFTLTAFKVTTASEGQQDASAKQETENAKSVAWYVANIKAAKAQNQECYDNPGLQSTPTCANALHALQIAFKGGN